MIVEVIINRNAQNLNRIFDYHVPRELQDQIKIGSRIWVPFGGKQIEEAFVIEIKENSNYQVKDIKSVEEIGLNFEKIQLAKWIANHYFCSIIEAIHLLLPPGQTNKTLSKRVKEKSKRCVYLKKEAEEIQECIETKQIKTPKQIRVLEFLLQNEGVTIQDLEIYADASQAVIKTLEKNGYIEIQEETINRDPIGERKIIRTTPLPLTDEQQKAYQSVKQALQDKRYEAFLLFGITGSGKTEIYLQLIEQVIKQGKSAILLVPEISLTPQMIERFIARFDRNQIAILHSKLSVGERYDEWNRIQKGEAKIVIGARSAIFAPVQNLGIILIDEEQDTSYQSEMTPRYDAKEIANYLAEEKHIPLVLGSATPLVDTFYQAQMGNITLLTLKQRANHAQLPAVELVDLRKELETGNTSIFSRKLYQAIKQNLEQHKQTILFLNRRGYATFVMCRECGYVAKCKNCDITLTYHSKQNKLKCHYCGYETEVMTKCPECQSNKIRYFGSGTQKIEEQIQKFFPQAKTIRMDVDTVTKKHSHEEILKSFREEKIDILIGTQMVVKGHHFPNVTLVGVIAADNLLYLEDYRANERTFDLLVQVAGRAGRERLPGRVIIQTYNTDNYSIEYAQKQDYLAFYQTEIMLRKGLNYPPFCDIIIIVFSSEKEEKLEKVAKEFYEYLKQKQKTLKIHQLLQPMPAPIYKIKNKYRWRMIIKCQLDHNMIEVINEYRRNTNNRHIQMAIYTNPNSMM